MVGGKLTVPTLDGEREVKIAAGTQPGHTERLKGLGLPSLRNGRRGSQYVVVELDRAEEALAQPARPRQAPARVARRRVIRLAVRCRPELAERVLAELLELVPGGVEEVGWVADPAPRTRSGGGGGLRVRDLRAAGRAARGPRARGRGRRGAGRDQLDRDPRRLGRPLARLPRAGRGRRRADRGQAVVGDGPSAPDPAIPGREAEEMAGIDVVIDPGQAFGTGAHATTEHVPGAAARARRRGGAAGPLADLGTGSGVLAIAAAKLGCAPVLACDSELAAVEAAAENAAANGVEIELERLNLRRAPPPPAPTLVANLTAPLLRDGRRPDRGSARGDWSARGCSRPRSSEVAAALGRRRARAGAASGARATGRRCCAAGFRRRRGIGWLACRRSP